MIPVVFSYLCAKGDTDQPPTFVFTEGELPAAPFPGLQVRLDRSGRRFVVVDVVWDSARADVFVAYVALHGDASPLQPSLGADEMQAAGWRLH